MSKSKKTRKQTKRRLKKEPQPRQRRHKRGIAVDARVVNLDLCRETNYITLRAQAGESRVVTLGSLVLFSTQSGDAWLLDREDGFAQWLCRDGVPQPIRMFDAADAFAVEWTADFAIEGAAFIVRERSGDLIVIHGYPTAEISAACGAP